MMLTTELTLTTPGLFFPAISLLFLSYTNKFLTLATLIRTLHNNYHHDDPSKKATISKQIANLRRRLILIKHMQGTGIMSFILCVIDMFLIYMGLNEWAVLVFGSCLVFLLISLVFCAAEIHISTEALDMQILDME